MDATPLDSILPPFNAQPFRGEVTRPRAPYEVILGADVFYVPGQGRPRPAKVIHVHGDQEATVDLVVFGEGDTSPQGLALTRQGWAMGNGLARARLDIPHRSKVQGRAVLAWCYREELAG